MKPIKYFLLIVCFFESVFSISLGQNIILKQSNETGIYKSGEKARITLFMNDKFTDSVSLKIEKNFTTQTSKYLKYLGDSIVLFDEILKGPETIIFEVKSKKESGSIGLIVDPEKYTPGTSRPKDFKKYWENEKKTLRALAMSVKSVPVKINETAFTCSDVEINCIGSKPARGYLVKPNAANPKSLPIVIYFHAAGVNGNWCRSEPGNAIRYAKTGKGALSFDLNAHGMLNGQSDKYYNHLDSFDLKNYAQQGLESKDDIYFRGMYLRLMRTIDYLTSQPEWDGKRILVMGESQGGGQALIAAGLDKRVSAVVVTVPAMCDWGGSLTGRKGSWPYPFSTKNDKEKMLLTLPYFDVAHILKGSKASIVVEIGLIDQTCPSSAVFAAINLAIGKKIILTVPYRAHHMTQIAYKEIWENTVYKTKEDFIKEFLK